MYETDSKVSIYIFTFYLNNVATKSPPETLLFRIVELIIGEVPWVLYFRLGHILITQTPRLSVRITNRFKQIWKSQIGTTLTAACLQWISHSDWSFTCCGSSFITPVFPKRMRLFLIAVSFLFSFDGEWEVISSFSSGISEKVKERKQI